MSKMNINKILRRFPEIRPKTPNDPLSFPLLVNLDGKTRQIGLVTMLRWVHDGWRDDTVFAVGTSPREPAHKEQTAVEFKSAVLSTDRDMLLYYRTKRKELWDQVDREAKAQEENDG